MIVNVQHYFCSGCKHVLGLHHSGAADSASVDAHLYRPRDARWVPLHEWIWIPHIQAGQPW